MTPVQYIKLIDILESFKPKRICELGSGISTIIFDIYCKKFHAKRFSIEHDWQYNNHTNLMPLTECTQLKIGNHIYDNCTRYSGLEEWLETQDKFDLVFIDGPNDGIPMNNQNLKFGRIQLLSFVLLSKLAKESIVMYHDSEHEIAQNTLTEFENLIKDYDKEIILETDQEIIDYNKKILGKCPELTIYKINI